MKSLCAALAPALALAASPVLAQEVGTCDWRASATVIAEPWEQHTRTFANGDVRVALLDAGEPAAGPVYLLVLSPGTDDEPWRHCAVVSLDGGIGFYDLEFSGLAARYDPARGLDLFTLAHIWLGEGNIVVRELSVNINQATGIVSAELDIG